MQIPIVPFFRDYFATFPFNYCYFHWSPRPPWAQLGLERHCTILPCTDAPTQWAVLRWDEGRQSPPEDLRKLCWAWFSETNAQSNMGIWQLHCWVRSGTRSLQELHCSSHYEKIPRKSPTNQAEPEELYWGRHFLVTVAQFSWTTVFSYQMIDHVAWHSKLTLGEPFNSRCSNKNILTKTEDDWVLMINQYLAFAWDWDRSRN